MTVANGVQCAYVFIPKCTVERSRQSRQEETETRGKKWLAATCAECTSVDECVDIDFTLQPLFTSAQSLLLF